MLVTTFVDPPVLTVCVPEQLVPSVAPVQVYVIASPAVGGVAMQGPADAHGKSDMALTVMVPLPPDEVRTLYWIEISVRH